MKEVALRCVYCGDGAGVTSDHIPPTCFFSVRPKNPITIPCCETCRVKDQKTDEFVRNLFSSTRGTESHQSVKGPLKEAQKRSYSYRPGKLVDLARITIPTPAGPAFDFNDVRVDRFLERTGRAVLYDAFKQPFFAASVLWKPLPPETKLIFSAPLSTDLRGKNIQDVFSYVTAELDENPTQVVMLRFYSTLLLAVQFSKCSS